MFDTQDSVMPLSLPTEITTEIFKQAIWMDIDTYETLYHDSDGPRSLVTPVTLRAVCRSWRAFIWDTPSLWSFIAVPLTHREYELQLRTIDTYLDRSGNHALDIAFRYDGHLGCERAGVALRKLVDHSPRWRTFDIWIEPELKDILSQVKGRVSLLQTGHLHWAEVFRIRPSTLDMFEDAPLLKGFTYNYPITNYIQLPWEQLTSVGAQWSILNLIRCTNLTECVFDQVYVDELLSGVTYVLPLLRSLVITDTDEDEMAKLLHGIRCPNLRRLQLSTCSDEHEAISFSEVEDFITRSNCALEHLRLEKVINISPAIVLLGKQPSLQYLSLRSGECHHYDPNGTKNFYRPLCNHEDTDPFLSSLLTELDLTSEKAVFLPNLAVLECKVPFPLKTSKPPSRSTASDLLKVLQQRWMSPPKGVARLRKIVVEDTITVDKSRDRIVVDGLRELVRDGMGISVPGLKL